MAKAPDDAAIQNADAAGSLRARYEHEARELIGRVACLPEDAMRASALWEAIAQIGPLRAVWTIETLIRGVLCKEAAHQAVYAPMVDARAILENLEQTKVDEMLRSGRDEGCVAALQWLLSPTIRSSRFWPQEDRLVHQDLRQVSLGDRRARARRAGPDAIERLAVDPDPVVITNLLSNPRVTEQTVLAICSRRPTVTAPLEAVWRHPRWTRRYTVKRALVRNPYLEQHLAVNLLPFLTRGDLVEIRDDETLEAMLRLSAQRLLDLDE